MAGSWPSNVSQGNFIPSTADITSLDPNSQEYRVRTYQLFNQIILAINQKSSGLYQFDETVDNNLWAPIPATVDSTAAQTATQKAEFRKVFIMPALVNAGQVELLHGIDFNSDVTFVHIYGTATDSTTPQARPLPYASATGNNAELWLDATKIYIKTTGAGWSTFTKVRVVVALLKN